MAPARESSPQGDKIEGRSEHFDHCIRINSENDQSENLKSGF